MVGIKATARALVVRGDPRTEAVLWVIAYKVETNSSYAAYTRGDAASAPTAPMHLMIDKEADIGIVACHSIGHRSVLAQPERVVRTPASGVCSRSCAPNSRKTVALIGVEQANRAPRSGQLTARDHLL